MLTPVPTKRGKRACTPPAPGHPAATVERQDAPTEEISTRSSSVDIAEALRRTTLRAHEAIRRDVSDVDVLRSLQAEITALDEEAKRLGLRALRPFLSSLRRKIESSF